MLKVPAWCPAGGTGLVRVSPSGPLAAFLNGTVGAGCGKAGPPPMSASPHQLRSHQDFPARRGAGCNPPEGQAGQPGGLSPPGGGGEWLILFLGLGVGKKSC